METLDDLNRIDDLPQDLQTQLKRKPGNNGRPSKFQPTILRLLGTHGELSLSQILVGIYRAHEHTMTRSAASGHMGKLRKRGLIESTGKQGCYRLTAKGKAIFAKAVSN